jgi:hypothetical protein
MIILVILFVLGVEFLLIVKVNKKGASVMTVLQYSLISIVVLVLIYWFIVNNPYKTYTLVNQIDSDRIYIAEMANRGCYSNNYAEKYNPKLKRGEITITKDILCIEVADYSFSKEKKIRRCSTLECSSFDGLKYNLEDTREIILIK